jgi:hypothetical protein
MSILPGVSYEESGELKDNWHSNFTTQYFELVKTYNDAILMSVGLSQGRADIKAPVSS